jgi:hypothetical protein
MFIEISDDAIRNRVNAIAQGPYREEFNARLLELQHANPVVPGSLNDAIDNVDGNTIRDRIRGYEAVVIFAGATILAYFIINHWRDLFSLLGRIPTTLLDPATVIERTFHLYNNPETRAQTLALINLYHNRA